MYNNSYQTPPAQVQVTTPWAIVSLISGIASYIIVPLIGAVVALITGYIAKKEIRNSSGSVSGGGMATVGIVLGWMNIVFALLAICLVILMYTGVIGSAAMCAPLLRIPDFTY